MAQGKRKGEGMLIICGHSGSGKSTAGEILSELTGLKKGETSDIIIKSFAEMHSVPEEEIRKIKGEIRENLVTHGTNLCWKEPDRLIRELYQKGCGIICGPRRLRELQGDMSRLFDYVIWINRNVGTGPGEQITVADCMAEIDNTGSKRNLRENLREFVNKHNLGKGKR